MAMTHPLKLPEHALEFASKQLGQLHLMCWSCSCGDRGEWRAADVSRTEADYHLKRPPPEMLAAELIADGPENVHRDAMTDEQLRRFSILKHDLVHAALSRAASRRQTAHMLTLVAESDERLSILVVDDGNARVIAETEREKRERELSATRAQHEENVCGRKLDAAADALLAEIERGR